MSCSEWKSVKVGDIADILSGYAFKTKDFIEEGVPVVKIKNIIPPNIDISDTQHVSNEMYEEKIKYALNYNDVLISMTGSNVNQIASAVGKIGRVRLKDTKLLLNQRVGKLCVKDNSKCNYDYLYYYLIQPEIRYNLAANAGGSANQANISPADIKNIDIKLPPLEEQEKIANMLSSLDEKIELNNEMNKTLEEMAQSIFKRWFVDFEFPNENGEPYKSSGGEMVEGELGMIPKGWEVKKMKDISNLMMGISPKSSSYNNDCIGVPLLNGAGDFYNGKIKPTKYTTEAKRVCNNGDIILSIRGTIGNLNFSDGEYCLGRSMCALRGKEHIDNMLIFMYMSKSIEQLKSNAIGSVIVGLSKPDIEEIMIAYPNYEIRKSLNDILLNLYSRKKHNIEENNNINAIRESLLPKLMSGDISTI